MNALFSTAFSPEEFDSLVTEERSAPSRGENIVETRLVVGLSKLREMSVSVENRETPGGAKNFSKKEFEVPGNGTEFLGRLLLENVPEGAPFVDLEKRTDVGFWVPDTEYMEHVSYDKFKGIQGRDLVLKMILSVGGRFPRDFLKNVVEESLKNFRHVAENGGSSDSRTGALSALVDVAGSAHALGHLDPAMWFSKIRIPEGEWRTGRGDVEISTRKEDAEKPCGSREIILSPEVREIPLWLPLLASGRYLFDGGSLLSEVDIDEAKMPGRKIMTRTCSEPDFSSPEPLVADDAKSATLLEVFAAWNKRDGARTAVGAGWVFDPGFSLDGIAALVERRVAEGATERMRDVAEFLSGLFFTSSTPRVRKGCEVVSSMCDDPCFGEGGAAFVQLLLEKMEEKCDSFRPDFRREFPGEVAEMEEARASAVRAFLEASERLRTEDEDMPPPL